MVKILWIDHFMPIENLPKSQNQGQLFKNKLSEQLDPKNKLYKLRELINWSILEQWMVSNVNISKFGRNQKYNNPSCQLIVVW